MRKYAVDGWKYFGELNEVFKAEHEKDFEGPGLYMLIEKGTDSKPDISYYIGRDSGSICERLKYHYYSLVNATYLIPLNLIVDEFQSNIDIYNELSEIDKKVVGKSNMNAIVLMKHRYFQRVIFANEDLFKRYIKLSFEFRKSIHVLYKPCTNIKNIAIEEKTMIATYRPMDNRKDTDGFPEKNKLPDFNNEQRKGC
jgi:hypothetical protein